MSDDSVEAGAKAQRRDLYIDVKSNGASSSSSGYNNNSYSNNSSNNNSINNNSINNNSNSASSSSSSSSLEAYQRYASKSDAEYWAQLAHMTPAQLAGEGARLQALGAPESVRAVPWTPELVLAKFKQFKTAARADRGRGW